ncbi:hypothetical protein [Georgenia sp. Z1491]|uniref:hypothetical protein n=1 Tax=Georgenia sp. Z1491 TaxID=3416707 RepID=UPI003CE9D5A8
MSDKWQVAPIRRPLPVVLVAGLALVVAGCGTLLFRLLRPVSFGWTRSPPVAPEFTPHMLVLDAANVLAALAVLVGVALVAGVAGHRVDRPLMHVEWAQGCTRTARKVHL